MMFTIPLFVENVTFQYFSCTNWVNSTGNSICQVNRDMQNVKHSHKRPTPRKSARVILCPYTTYVLSYKVFIVSFRSAAN